MMHNAFRNNPKVDDMLELTGWENFYVIVGSSAGALIGLQFVVITLIADMPIIKDVERASSAFATPTIVHFASVLILSAIISAPWHAMLAAAVLWGLIGLAGFTYVAIVTYVNPARPINPQRTAAASIACQGALIIADRIRTDAK